MAITSFKRYELKFIITQQQFDAILPEMLEHMTPDAYCRNGTDYCIYNIYYDTSDNCIIRSSLSGPYYKEKPKASHMQLTVTVPENLNYQGLFDDILDQYTDSWKLKRVKTSDFGTLFDVVYNIHMKSSSDQKKFIDELRCRNGNLTISLTLKEYETGTALA